MNSLSGNLPNDLQNAVDAEMGPGERVVWSGQPIPGRFARKALPAVLFGIPWTAFAVFWTCMAARGTWASDSAGWFKLFPLWGLPFVLIGVGMLSSPYWARRKALRTAYVVTDRRTILFLAGWGRSRTVRSFEPERLGDLRRRQRPDGSGDLVFTQEWRSNSDSGGYATEIGFLGIPDVREVEGLVRRLVENRRPPT